MAKTSAEAWPEQEVREVRNELVVSERVQDFRKESSEHTIVENKVRKDPPVQGVMESTRTTSGRQSSQFRVTNNKVYNSSLRQALWSTPSAGSKAEYQSCGQHRCWRISTCTAWALLKRLHRFDETLTVPPERVCQR
jgi:hypothetical protein